MLGVINNRVYQCLGTIHNILEPYCTYLLYMRLVKKRKKKLDKAVRILNIEKAKKGSVNSLKLWECETCYKYMSMTQEELWNNNENDISQLEVDERAKLKRYREILKINEQ